jgi:predicted RNA-binding Zn-ribbon protein involved in translation (DUF1610 family)
MSVPKEEPILIVPQPPKNLCPICGQVTYSAGGIHPQCAMQQADEPRLARMKTRKAAETKTKKPARNVWKRQCPKCGAQAHVRQAVCKCGHKLQRVSR